MEYFNFLVVISKDYKLRVRARVMVFHAIFNNIPVILCRSVLLLEETRVPRENLGPVAIH